MRHKNRYNYSVNRQYSYSGLRNTYIENGRGRKKKNHIWIITLISILFVLAACVAAFFIMDGMSIFNGDTYDSNIKSTFLDKSKIEHMLYSGEKYEALYVETEDYLINYPSTKIDNIDKEINDRVSYFSKCSEASSARFTAVDYITETADDKYLSIVFKAKEYDNNKKLISAYVSTMMFELETNKLLDDEQVFKNSFYNFASEYVRTYFNNNIDTKKKTSDETFLSATSADKIHFGEYSINDNKCTLYMNQKELFGSGSTIYEIPIALSELDEYLEISLENAKNTIKKASTIRDNLDPNKPMVALTFDDGPHSENTEIILDVLKQYNARATFFVVGYNAEANTDVLKKISDAGCQIGNHTKDHSNLTELTDDEIKEEADYVDKIVKNVTGSPTTALRPPYGAYSERVQQILNKTPLIFWNVDTEDWENLDKDKTTKAVISRVSDGNIVLMHDIHSSTAEAIKEIVPKLVAKGYQLVTVEELLYYKELDIKGGETYPW